MKRKKDDDRFINYVNEAEDMQISTHREEKKREKGKLERSIN